MVKLDIKPWDDETDLKGKDPQIRTWENINNYQFIGSVVHKVTPGVDEGPVLCEHKVSTSLCIGIDSTFLSFSNRVKNTSLSEVWCGHSSPEDVSSG
jgi:folate-dependent phosphoribosylglycinamide formyltransferase PurN